MWEKQYITEESYDAPLRDNGSAANINEIADALECVKANRNWQNKIDSDVECKTETICEG